MAAIKHGRIIPKLSLVSWSPRGPLSVIFLLDLVMIFYRDIVHLPKPRNYKKQMT